MRLALKSALGKLVRLGTNKPVSYLVEKHKSPEGIDYFLHSSRFHRTASVGFAFKGGTSAHVVGNPVTAILLPQSIMDSSNGADTANMSESLSELGAGFFMRALPRALRGSLTAPADKLANACEIGGRLFTEAVLSEEALNMAKIGTSAQMQDASADPKNVIQKAFVRSMFGADGYFSHLFVGADEIQSAKLANLSEFRTRHIVRNRLVTVVAGDLSPEAAGSLVDVLFAGLDTGEAPEKMNPVTVRKMPDSPIRIAGSGQQVNVAVGCATSSAKEPEDFLAARMLAHILAGGQDSRLFRAVRDKNGKTYGFEHHLALFDSSGMFAVHGAIDRDGYEDTIADVMKTIDRFLEFGPDDREAETTKEVSRQYFHNAQLDAAVVAQEILNFLDCGWSVDQINDIDQSILGIDLMAERHRRNLIGGDRLLVIVE